MTTEYVRDERILRALLRALGRLLVFPFQQSGVLFIAGEWSFIVDNGLLHRSRSMVGSANSQPWWEIKFPEQRQWRGNP